MSNVLRDQCGFFPIPRELIDAGHLRELSPSAVKLYVLLFGLAQKHSATILEIPSYELHDYTGLSKPAAKRGRLELEHRGLITSPPGAQGVLSYALMNPVTGCPLPAPQGRTGVRRHRPKAERSARTSARLNKKQPTASPDWPPEWDEIGATEEAVQ